MPNEIREIQSFDKLSPEEQESFTNKAIEASKSTAIKLIDYLHDLIIVTEDIEKSAIACFQIQCLSQFIHQKLPMETKEFINSATQ